MSNKILGIMSIAAVTLALGACASMEWVATAQPSQIKELADAKTIGIAVLGALTPNSDHVLVKVGTGELYNPVDIAGVTNKVAILYTAPTAVTAFAVNKDTLSSLCRDVAVQLIGSTGDFDYTVNKGFSAARLMSKSLTGEKALASYEKVVAITESLDRNSLTSATMQSLGAKYGVDAILVLQPSVYGEIGLVSAVPSEHTAYMDVVKAGDFMLRSTVDVDYLLFSGRTGAKITDSSATHAPYDQGGGFGGDITNLNTKDINAVKNFVTTPDYLALFSESMKNALVPYLSLFRPVYLGVMQEVKKQ